MNVGTVYKIDHERKGNLVGKLLHIDETWATFLLDEDSIAEIGHDEAEITLRRSLFTATERAG